MEYIEFEPGQKFARPGADKATNADAFKDAGIVLKNNDVVVDIDSFTGDRENLKEMLTELGINTQTVFTKRGAHLYFKKPTTFKQSNGSTALGIKVEYKHTKNAPNGVTFRREGVNRPMINEGERQELPWFLKPWKKAPEFLGRTQGDNRQTDLWEYTSFLAKGHDRDAYMPVLKAINNYVFDEPLNEADFEHATREREAALAADETEDMTIARQIVTDLKCKVYNGRLMYMPADPQQAKMVGAPGEWYVQDVGGMLGLYRIVSIIYCADQPRPFKMTVYENVQQLAEQIPDARKFNNIRLRNGFLMRGQFAPLIDDEFTPFYINRSFDSNPEPVAAVDELLKEVTNGNEEMVEYLLEMAGYSFITNPSMKRDFAKVFFIYGPGGNGKSTFLDLLRRALGYQNTSALSLEDLSDSARVTLMVGKLVNLGDDQPNVPIDGKMSANLKNFSTGSAVTTRELYKGARDIEMTANLIFTTNHVLTVYDKAQAMQRRIVWVPMLGHLNKMGDDFWNELNTDRAADYFFQLMVPAFQRLLARGAFPVVEEMKQTARKLEYDNNSVLAYLQGMELEELTGKPAGEAYRDYKEAAEFDESPVLPKKLFDQSVEDIFGLVPTMETDTVTNKRAKWYRDIEGLDEHIASFIDGADLNDCTKEEVQTLYAAYRATHPEVVELSWPRLVDKIVDHTDLRWVRRMKDGAQSMRFIK